MKLGSPDDVMQQGDLFERSDVQPRGLGRAADALRAHLAGTVPLALTQLQAAVRAVAAEPARDDHADLLARVCQTYGAGDATFGPYTEVTAAIDGLAALPSWRRRRLLGGLVRRRALDPARLPAMMQAEWAAMSPDREAQLETCLRGTPELRRAACAVAADMGLTRTVSMIRPLLADPVACVAASAAVALGRMGDPVARPHLEDMIRDVADGVRPAAPLQVVLDGLLPVATAESKVVLRRAARRLTGEAGAAAEEALAELAAV